MTHTDAPWRKISHDEVAVISQIVASVGTPGVAVLTDGISDALVRSEETWILDVQAPGNQRCNIADGPLPVRAFVPSQAEYAGEIILWITEGRLSGLEYAWITDEPPTRWPRVDEIEVVAG